MRRECRERFPHHREWTIPARFTARAVTHVPWCMPGSLTHGFLCRRWRGKRSRHSQRMRNPQFYVSGKWPIAFLSSFERGAKLNNSGLIFTWSKSFDYAFFTKMPRAIVPNHLSNLIWELDGSWYPFMRGSHRHRWVVIQTLIFFFVVSLNKLLYKQSSCQSLQTGRKSDGLLLILLLFSNSGHFQRCHR